MDGLDVRQNILMPQLVTDCPRCGASKTTFNVIASHDTGRREHDWVIWFDTFCVCRNCNRTVTFILRLRDYDSQRTVLQGGVEAINGSVNDRFEEMGFQSLKDQVRNEPPEHLPEDIASAFREGATCLAVNCYNGAGTMFRLCIDHATRALLPENDTDGLNRNIRRSLGLRMRWLFDQGILPASLRELSACVREDGNDGAHAGTLSRDDADDLCDFTFVLLERLYTEPERIRLAEERRRQRRGLDPNNGEQAAS